MALPEPLLDTAKLLEQLRELGAIGHDAAQGGRTRIALTDEEKKAGRDLLVRWMRELDLEVRVDQIGNILACCTQPTRGHGPAADDGVAHRHGAQCRRAGWLLWRAGGLGRGACLPAGGPAPARAIVVAAFTNEEGVRYQPDMMGSLVYAGGMDVQAALNTVGTDGTRLGDELARIGYAGDMAPGAIVPREYIELHIEQGPVLEAEGKLIGVVESLQGISWQKVTITGVANHAGTTPTRLRHDAGYAAAACVAFLREQVVGAAPETTLATVGSLRLEPDLINVIPAGPPSPWTCVTLMSSVCKPQSAVWPIFWPRWPSARA